MKPSELAEATKLVEQLRDHDLDLQEIAAANTITATVSNDGVTRFAAPRTEKPERFIALRTALFRIILDERRAVSLALARLGVTGLPEEPKLDEPAKEAA